MPLPTRLNFASYVIMRKKKITLGFIITSFFIVTYKTTKGNQDHIYSLINSFKSKEDFIFDFFNRTENDDPNVFSLDNFTSYFDDISNELEKYNLPLCPKKPPGLKGDLKRPAYLDSVLSTYEKISIDNPRLSIGGKYAPKHCRPRFKLAIIIPLRGRIRQLRVLLAHMHPIWQRQQLDYTVYVMWQSGKHLFNKAKIMNAGFLEASKDRKYDCYVFHDVDMLLENDECLYWCPTEDNPRSLSVYVDKFSYRFISYRMKCRPSTFPRTQDVQLFGGVVMVTKSQFMSANGFSNIYWGWGGEDDDLYFRLWNHRYQVHNPYGESCSYHMLQHETENSNAENKGHFALMTHAISRMKYEGLNTLRYKHVSTKRELLFTNITIDVGQPMKQYVDFMMYNATDDELCHRWMPWQQLEHLRIQEDKSCEGNTGCHAYEAS
ncbi:beta-1,4-galactosyltransferase 4-like isoform X1 [Styela clava]